MTTSVLKSKSPETARGNKRGRAFFLSLVMTFLFPDRVNSSEYFPIFLALLWQAGLFFHQGENIPLPVLSLDLFPCVLPQYSGPDQLLNNKLSSNSDSDGRVEPEDTESLFLCFGLPPWFQVALKSLWRWSLWSLLNTGLAAALGLLYLYARYCYFMGYKASPSER